jgi:hypothetical protein
MFADSAKSGDDAAAFAVPTMLIAITATRTTEIFRTDLIACIVRLLLISAFKIRRTRQVTDKKRLVLPSKRRIFF